MIIFVYGTLRPGTSETVTIPGKMYDLGWFPGVILGGDGKIVCERVEVDDIDAVDRYEGYDPHDLANSLYIRRSLLVPYGLEGFIYEYNRPIDPLKIVEGGDWLAYKKESRGRYGDRFGKAA